ncbi:MAG: hypothetical protein V3S55_06295 [Nitrospiraceae bacterium]
MFIKVDYPGYFLDGEILEGRRAKLHVGKRRGSGPPGQRGNASYGADIDCYLVKDPDTGESFGIPTNRAVVMKDPPVIDLRGRLHADAGMFAEVV